MFLKITAIGRNQVKTLPKLFKLCAPKFLLIIKAGEIVYKVCVLMIEIILMMIIRVQGKEVECINCTEGTDKCNIFCQIAEFQLTILSFNS